MWREKKERKKKVLLTLPLSQRLAVRQLPTKTKRAACAGCVEVDLPLNSLSATNDLLCRAVADQGQAGGACREGGGTPACTDANAVCGDDKLCQCKDGFVMSQRDFKCSEYALSTY